MALFENGRRSAARWDSKLPSRSRRPFERFVFLYGRYRRVLLPDSPDAPRNLTDAQYLDELTSHAAQSRTLTLTRPDNRLLQDLPGYLRGLYSGRASDPRFDAMWSRLNAALPQLDSSLSRLRMDPGTDTLIPRMIRNGVALDFAELSDGYQAILVVVLDLILRYYSLFFEGDPLEGSALVGIDEIELHLHPSWQRTVLPQLTNLFKNTQFILTTHSPIVVQAAIDQNFTVLRLIEKDNEVTAQRVSPGLMKRLRGADIGSLLFEEHLFGVESRFSVEYARIEQRVEELQSLVSRGKAKSPDYEELKRGLDTLEELVAKEDRRRADGSTMAQMVRMQAEFVKALTDELEKARK